jgi:hypothetical protein
MLAAMVSEEEDISGIEERAAGVVLDGRVWSLLRG